VGGVLGPGINNAEARKVIMAEVKATVLRREPLTRLTHDYVRAGIIQRNPGIEKFYPWTKKKSLMTMLFLLTKSAKKRWLSFLQSYLETSMSAWTEGL